MANPDRTLQSVRAAGPLGGRDVAKEIGSMGAPGIDILEPGLRDPAIARHCTYGVGVAGTHGAKARAREILLDVARDPVSDGAQDEAEYYLARLWQSGIGKYMAPYGTWHHIVDEIALPDGSHWYLSACRHWNSEGHIDKRGGLREQVAEPCPLCEAADASTVAEQEKPAWSPARLTAAGGTKRLFLRGDAAWHVAQGDDAFQTVELRTVYLTHCGWWIPAPLVRGRGPKFDIASACHNCGSFDLDTPGPAPEF